MKKMVLGKLLSVQKIATKKILTWNVFTQFINCLSLPNTSFWQIFTNVKTLEKENSLLSNINDNSNNNEKKKEKKRKKTRVGSGNIWTHGWEYSWWEFSRGDSPGGSLIGGNSPGGSFPDTEENLCEKFSSVHALALIFIRKISILQTHSLCV